VSVEYNTSLKGFTQDDKGVTITLSRSGDEKGETLRANYLIGCDGGRGTVFHYFFQPRIGVYTFPGAVRKLAGISFVGETSPEFSMLIGEAELEGAIDKEVIVLRSLDESLLTFSQLWHQYRPNHTTG